METNARQNANRIDFFIGKNVYTVEITGKEENEAGFLTCCISARFACIRI
jgi:hypothetical protein